VSGAAVDVDEQVPPLAAYLADRDYPCPGCGYNLRGLKVRYCPECRQELQLQVGLVDAGLGRVIGAASGFLGGACGAVMCLILAVAVLITQGPPSRKEVFAVFGIPIIMAGMQGVLTIALMSRAGRQLIRELRPAKVCVLGCVGWLITILFVGWFLWLVF
jgi:hypothetical protein